MIPRILHQVWVGPDPMPTEFVEFGESWRRHHPDWEMRFWTEENLPDDLVRPEAYERLRNPAERSDIIRLEVLFRFGGVYVDTDVECLRPIDPLVPEGVDFFVGRVKGEKVTNAVIGAVDGHPVLDRALRELRPVTEFGVDKSGTGPGFLTALLREHPEVTVYPRELLYQVPDAQHMEAYVVHHLAASWKTSEHWSARGPGLQRKLAEAQARIYELEALVGLHGPSAGIRVWRSRLRFGKRLRRTVQRPHLARGRR